MPKKRDWQLVHMRIDAELIKKLETFRFRHRIETRTEAIEWLLNWALERRPARSRIAAKRNPVEKAD
jgi:hypothetical protein